MKTLFRFEDQSDFISYESATYQQTYEPLWSDGSFDGSYIPKMVGAIPNIPEGEIVLSNGDVFKFSTWESTRDKTGNEIVTIKQPYYLSEVRLR